MSAEEYVEHAYLTYVLSEKFDKIAGDQWLPEEQIVEAFENAMPESIAQIGYVTDRPYSDIVAAVVEKVRQAAFQREGDEFTGEYCFMAIHPKDAAVRKMLAGNPVGARTSKLGATAFDRAYQRVAEREGWRPSPEQNERPPTHDEAKPYLIDERTQAPAADRIVTFSDNQVEELDQQSSELIQAVEEKNQIDGEPGLRELIVGQLKAGRELIRAGSFRLFFLQLTLIETLEFLAKRYEKEAIGGLAAALIAALLKHIGLDS